METEDTEERSPCDSGGRDGAGTPRMAGGQQLGERHGTGFSP